MKKIYYKETEITQLFKAGKWSHPDTGIKYPANWNPLTIEGVTVIDEPELMAEPPTPEPKTQYLPLEYLELFTEQEQLLVVSATIINPQVKLWYDKMLAASFIDITDPRTVMGLDALVLAGLLTEERKTIILTLQ